MRNLRNIERIYENVYSMNENMMVRERRALIQGFEDVINEGWFSNAMGKAGKLAKGVKDKYNDTKDSVKAAYNDTKDSVKAAYNKGKEMASSVIDNVKEFIQGIMTSIEEKFNEAKTNVVENYTKYKNQIKEAYASAMTKISEGWNKLKDKGEEMVKSIKATYNNVLKTTKEQIEKAAKLISESPEKTKAWIIKNKESLTETANALIKKGKKIGKVILHGIGELALAPVVITYLLFEGAYTLIIITHKNTTAKIPELYKLGLTAIQERSEKIRAEYQAGIENFKKEYNGVSESFRYLKRFNDFY